MEKRFCTACGSVLKENAQFCTSCGREVRKNVLSAEQFSPITERRDEPRTTLSKNKKIGYVSITLVLITIFGIIFAKHLPGGPNPVIAMQPEVSMGISYPDQATTPEQIIASVENGKITFPLPLLLEKKIISFDYKNGAATVPLMAYISAEGKLVTTIRLCEPCNSTTFTIEGNELACGKCETRWNVNNLEGLQGSCQKYPPDPIPSEVVGMKVLISEDAVKKWKMRI